MNLLRLAKKHLFLRLKNKSEYFCYTEHNSAKRARSFFAKIITVLPRKYYREYNKKVPVTKGSDLKKLIAVEKQLKSKSSYVFHKVVRADKYSTITYYEVDREFVKQNLPTTWFVVPETIVLGKLTKLGSASQYGNLFIGNANEVYISSFITPVISELNRFAEANGLDASKSHVESEVPNLAIEAISKLNIIEVLTFYNRNKIDTVARFNYKPYLLTAIAAFIISQASISTWLLFKNASVQDDIRALEPQVSGAFLLASETAESNDKIDEYRNLLEDKQFTSFIWLVLNEAFEQDAKIIFARLLLDGSFSVSLEAEDVNQVIKVIDQMEIVDRVELDGDVQRYRQRQRFKLSITLRADK